MVLVGKIPLCVCEDELQERETFPTSVSLLLLIFFTRIYYFYAQISP